MIKKKLLRDTQIVGYERTTEDLIERSYDNQIWTPNLEIPHDDEKLFLEFDLTNLVEIYES